MYLDDTKQKRKRKTITIAFIAGAAVLLAAFWHETSGLAILLWAIVKRVFNLPVGEFPADILHSISIVSFNCVFGFALIFSIWLLVIASQALLPVTSFKISLIKPSDGLTGFKTYLKENLRTAWHLILYITRQHGPAVFVRDGKAVETEEDQTRIGPGVLVIDYNSAAVLEEQISPPGMIGPLINMLQQFLTKLGLADPYQSPRTTGQGIVFTRTRERIRSVVDLRQQSRSKPNVKAYTRDGIELSTNLWVLFTIGQEPEVLHVTLHGERRPDNIQVLSIQPTPDGMVQINLLSEQELSPEDRQSVHQLTRSANRLPFQFLSDPSPLPVYDTGRVFAAVASEARSKNYTRPWDDLPIQIATEIFRELLTHINYDQLYRPNQDHAFPLVDIKNDFQNSVRNSGLLSFRMLYHRNNNMIVDGIYSPADLLATDIINLPASRSTVLRERGIKVISSGFTDLNPPPAIYNQHLDSWKSNWERETRVINAGHELEAMRIRSRAKAQAQQEIIQSLSGILSMEGQTGEALAIRVYQALESIAADQQTQLLLPAETTNLMRNLHDWLLPNESSRRLPPEINLNNEQ